MAEGKRTYRSAVRAEHAEQTRDAVIAAAAECFIQRGYAETTMKDIAARAGVSAPTVYAQGSKAALLLAAVDRSLVGDAAPVPLIQRDQYQRLMDAHDKTEKLRLMRELAIDRLPPIGPILRAFRNAAPGDAEIAAAWQEYERRRYSDTRVLVQSFSHLLRPGLTVERATDIYWAIFNSETADAFLIDRNWSLSDYADWLVDSVVRLFLS